MKLTTELGEIALPEDFSFDIESHHPFFSDEGTSSIPVTIPSVPENFKIFGNPENIHNKNRHIREYSAFLQSGVFQKRCRLISESAGRKSGISASLALLESELYAELQDRKLKDIFAQKTFAMTKSEIGTPYDVYKGLLRNSWYLNDVAVFPVATDADENWNVSVLNEPLSGKLKDEARTVTVGGNTFSAPAGYGITLFLYLWAMIEETFAMSGYRVVKNVFKTDPELKEIVLVNNCADLCCSYGYNSDFWGFNYSDLVPNITVGEMIVFLRDTFGAYVTYDNGDISVRLFRDDVHEAADADITHYARDEYSVFFPEPKSLERSLDTSIDSAAPAAETLVKLRAAHENMAEAVSVSAITGTGLFYIPVLGKYYYKQSSSASPQLLGSDCFTYSRETDLEPESVSSQTRFLPMVLVNGRYMPYIGERIHKYISVEDKDKDADQPIQLCYAHFYDRMDKQVFCGSSYSYYEDATKAVYTIKVGTSYKIESYPELTPEGLAGFWKDYESLLLNSAPEIEAILDIPLETLPSINRYTPKLFNGALVIIKSLSYSISDAGVTCITARLQLLPSYSDSRIPGNIMFGTSYGWKLVSTRNIFDGNGYEIIETDGLTDYTSVDAPKEVPGIAGIITKKRSRWLRYKYTERYSGWLHWGKSTRTGTHQWEEYFIAEASA